MFVQVIQGHVSDAAQRARAARPNGPRRSRLEQWDGSAALAE